MRAVCEILRFLAAAALGVYAGAMLTEGGVLVPYWRSLPAEEFFRWYAANDARLLGFFGPLTAAPALLAIAAAAVALARGEAGRWLLLGAAAIAVATVASFFVYFRDANASFSAASLPPADLPAELARWAAWHWARTVLALVAFAMSLLALRRAH